MVQLNSELSEYAQQLAQCREGLLRERDTLVQYHEGLEQERDTLEQERDTLEREWGLLLAESERILDLAIVLEDALNGALASKSVGEFRAAGVELRAGIDSFESYLERLESEFEPEETGSDDGDEEVELPAFAAHNGPDN